MSHAPPSDRWVGLALATLLLSAWAATLVAILRLHDPWGWYTLPAVALRTWLSTGLFIIAHDAMHRTLHPVPWLNDGVGRLALAIYALLPWTRVRTMHHLHHAHPAIPGDDPDFHDGTRKSLPGWYFTFLRRYVSLGSVVGMAVAFNVLHHGLQLPQVNLWLYWVGPALLSTVQLFVVGTWLPHREPHRPGDVHRARSVDLPRPLSLLACFHFGYHRAHHEAPWIPWYRLQPEASPIR